MKQIPAMDSGKRVYSYFVNERKTRPRVEYIFPNIIWENILENLSHGFIPSECKSQMFLLYNDLVITKDKLVKYNIGRLSNNLCDYCPTSESNKHILKDCVRTNDIRSWLGSILKERWKIAVTDLEDIISWKINRKDKRQKAALWLTMLTYTNVLKSYPNCSLFVLRKNIRDARWNNRRYFKKCFGNCLNIA